MSISQFNTQDMGSFFNQTSSYVVLMDLLYESGRYDLLEETMNMITLRQLATTTSSTTTPTTSTPISSTTPSSTSTTSTLSPSSPHTPAPPGQPNTYPADCLTVCLAGLLKLVSQITISSIMR